MSRKQPKEESNLRRKLREYEEQQRARQAPPMPPAQPPAPAPRPPLDATQPRATKTTTKKARREVRPFGLYVPWWGILIVVAMVALGTCALWTFVLTTRDDIAGEGLFTGMTPTFLIITKTPPQGELAPLEPPTPAPPTVEVTATVALLPDAPQPTPEGEIMIGSQVTIFGTEGDGLAMRQGPGLNYATTERADGTFMIARDGEVFVVEDGPRENDDFVWWYITDPNDPDHFGWAVQDYMLKVPEPDTGPLQEATPEPTEEAENSQ